MSGRGGGPGAPPRGKFRGGGGGPPRGTFQGGGRGGGGGGGGGGRGAGNARSGGDSRGSTDRGRGRGDSRGGGGGGRGGGGGGGNYKDEFEGEAIYHTSENIVPPAADVDQQENALIRPGQEISLSSLALDELPLPFRPSYGTKGRPILLRTNYFQLSTTRPNAEIFRYEIDISPKIKNPQGGPNRRKTRRLLELLIASDPNLKGVATDDSKFLVSPKKLALGDTASITIPQKFWEVEDEENGPRSTLHQVKIFNEYPMPFQQLLEYLSTPPGVTRSSFDKAEVVQALNLIMTRTANESQAIYGGGVRNKFYKYPNQEDWFHLGSGLIAVKGFYTSVRTSTLRLLVNINVANGAFYPAINLLGLMRKYIQDRGNNVGLEAFISRLKVSHNYIRKKQNDPKSVIKRVKTVLGFSHPKQGPGIPLLGNAHQIRFKCAELNDATVSVCEYFQRKYSIRLDKPDDPVINVGSKEKPSWVPPELLTVEPGQQYARKLDESQTAKMINFAVRTPAENARRIVERGAETMGLSETNPSLVRTVQYKVGKIPKAFPTSAGNWDIRGRLFSDARPLRNWTFIKFVQNIVGRQDVEGLRGILRNSGLSSDEPRPFPNEHTVVLQRGKAYEDPNDKKIRQTLETASQNGLKVLLIILPDSNAYIYSRVKFWAEVKYDIKLRKGASYWANLAHKFNLKLGGVNQTLPADKLGILADGKTMLVGMDVTHPSPGSIEGAPSIAGIVASIDGRYGQWPASMRAQTSRQEMIDKLDELFGERLDAWRKYNQGGLPTRIIIYRDGVSEGQYRTLLQNELPQVQKACEKRYLGGKLPKISVIVCGKRHHTRFYPTRDEDADNIQKNPLAGTVVDRGVTMEKGWDFFLQAHSSPKGTARPTHYVIIYDKNGMNQDAMEAMTHNLCYLFGRATKAVSLCPPAYYADLLCERGRAYLYQDYNGRDSATTSSSPKFDWDRAAWLRGVHPSIQDSMFYV
ncbi:MAG: hypothetical protein Q9184_002015 [Pyrenodesmia sp. 2 TL-2023]